MMNLHLFLVGICSNGVANAVYDGHNTAGLIVVAEAMICKYDTHNSDGIKY